MRTLTDRWVFPVTGPPIEDGAAAFEGGRILRVGRRAELAAEASAGARWELGDAALLPGLVNCHTHLELGGSVPCAQFDPGPRHLSGLQTFLAMLTESGALPRDPSLSFISV